MLEVHHDKGVANRIGLELCAGAREGVGEASVGERTGQLSSHESYLSRVPTALGSRKATRTGAPSRMPARPGVLAISDAYMQAPYSTSERNADLWQAASRRPGFDLLVAAKPSRLPSLSDHLRQCELFGISQDEARQRFHAFMGKRETPVIWAFPGQMFAVSNVPIHVPEHFMGRDDALAAIETCSEFIAQSVRTWITGLGGNTAYVAPGPPWENGYVESFNARLREEFLNGEIFYTLREAQIVIETWRRHCNTVRPYGALNYRPQAPEVFVPVFTSWPAALTRPAPPAKLTVVQRPTLH